MIENSKPYILVTGAAGALAQNVINRLEASYNIVAIDFREKIYLGDHIPSYCIDFTKRVFEDIFRKYPFKSVIHLGRIMSSQEDHMRRYNANVLGTQKLIELSNKYSISSIIILSTYHVYGASPYNPALIDEDAPLKAAELTRNLVDSVELENLANVSLWKYPNLNITLLRPCNIVGPGVKNTISELLSSRLAPVLAGFSPMMQFIHIDDMAEAIVLASKNAQLGVYNVAPEDWISLQEAIILCGTKRLPIPSLPPSLPILISKTLGLRSFPSYLINYFKYPVIIDGSKFNKLFGFKPKKQLIEIFSYYTNQKKL
jgi:UDP-glucose 4-epimerase